MYPNTSEELAVADFRLQDSTNSSSEAGAELPNTLNVSLLRALSSAIIVTVNILTMVAFTRVRSLRTLSNNLVICLASTDLMVGVITFVSALVWLPRLGEILHFSPESCVFRICWFLVCCAASMVNISFIAAERYLYIVHPYLHVQYVTPAVIKGCMCFVWVFGITVGGTPAIFAKYKTDWGCDLYLVVGSDVTVWVTCIVFFTTSLLTLFFYSLIARFTLKMRRAVGTFQHTTAASNAARLASLRIVLTSIKAPVVVYGVFVLCWSPHIVVYLVHHFGQPLPQKFRGWFTTVGLFNSAMNFFVYLCFNAQFRRTVLGYFTKGARGGATNSGGCSQSSSSARRQAVFMVMPAIQQQSWQEEEKEMHEMGCNPPSSAAGGSENRGWMVHCSEDLDEGLKQT